MFVSSICLAAHLREESTHEGASLGCVPLVTATMRLAASAASVDPAPAPAPAPGDVGALEGEGGALCAVRKEMGNSSAAEM